MAEIMPQFSHFLHEWAIYGNDSYGRVAVVRPDGGCDRGKARAGNDKKSFKEIFDEDNENLVGVRTILEKYYEIKDHLGNVRLVLMDQKVSQNNNQAPFAAIPVELNNYYPFGLPEAGRSWSYQGVIFEYQYNKYENYTYGYNGMQRDNSKGLGSGYTTLFREYDPEIARWKSLDPKLKDFPSESPFSAMGNNPIMNTDVLGDEIWIAFNIKSKDGSSSIQKVRYKAGELYSADGKKYTGGNEYAKKVKNALNQLAKDDNTLANRIKVLDNSEKKHTISMPLSSDDGNSNQPNSSDNEADHIPTGSITKYDPDKKTDVQGNIRPPRVGLAHELLGHAYDCDQGTTDFNRTKNGIKMYEVNAIKIENKARAAAGYRKRTKYGGKLIPATLLKNNPKKKGP